MNKKVLLIAYTRKNLGDDLFICMLLQKYPKVEFILRNTKAEYIEPFKKYPNCTFIEDKETLLTIPLDDYSLCIYIGGSILFEHGEAINNQKHFSKFADRCKEQNIPFIYMSSNFGPYKTKEFYEECKKTIEKLNTITFRDKYSYNEFKEIEGVKYASDLVFGLKIRKRKTIKNSIGISVIDLGLKSRDEKLKNLEEEYIQMYIDNITNLIDKNYIIYLYSFCEYEGDLKAIKKILSNLPEKYSKKVKIVKYTGQEGNMYDFIEKYSKMEKFICTRFHSVVLSLLFEQKIMVISYSQKIQNLLNDLTTKFRIFSIDNKIKKIQISDKNFVKVNKKDINKLKSEYNIHFETTDKILYKTSKRRIKIKKIAFFKRVKRKIKYFKKKICK